MEKREDKCCSVKKIQPKAVAIVIFFLLYVGVIIFPIHLRTPFLQDSLGIFTKANIIVCVAIVFSLISKRDYTKKDVIMIVLWLLMLIPFWISDRDESIKKIIYAIFNCWIPYFIIIYKGRRDTIKKILGVFLVAFDVFIIILMFIAIHEKITDGGFLHSIVSALTSHGYKCSELTLYESFGDHRFYFIWGHTLTNAVLFNIFFIVNDIFFRCIERKYPKILFFIVALVGVLICASKTGIVVLGLYLVISSWNQKKWLLAYVAAGVVFFLAGGFNHVIERFTTGSLTTGRVAALKEYFSSGIYPLQFFYGYGTGTTYCDEMYHLKAGFEFPPLMLSLDYGILFAVVMLGSIYVYASYYLLRNKQIVCWIGYSLLFAQFNTYNGISLWNQDICAIMTIFTMIIINCAEIYRNNRDTEGDM